MPHSGKSRLYIPALAARPGQPPDFSRLHLSPAGAVSRPDPTVAASATRELVDQLIRVLEENGAPVGEWACELAPETLLQGLRAMLLTRTFDDRMFRLQRQGKTSFYIKSTGEEAIAAAASLLMRAEDMCFPTYRSLSWLMARRYPLLELVNQIFSNASDPLKGRQLPVLYSARQYGFYSLSGNVGTRFGHAVGWAMAAAYRGTDQVAFSLIGEGTTAEGDFHEALTFASVYRAPVVFGVTNNQWAISSYSGIAGADEVTFAAKAIGYGIPGLRVDGNDFLAVWAVTAWAVERARRGLGATLIEYLTYRAEGHSTSDDPARYRPADEPALWPLGDPIKRLQQHLLWRGIWDAERQEVLHKELTDAVRTAVREGESVGTLGKSKPSAREMFEGVFEEPDWRTLEQRREYGI
jgi:2-oxoisovalerate dehydrogenase E1 component alpha subunit